MKFSQFLEFCQFFEISYGNHGQMAVNITNFFVISVRDDAIYILVEFESDGMSPRESAKKGRMGAHGLNCKIFDKSELMIYLII